jgi:hypothetical protein
VDVVLLLGPLYHLIDCRRPGAGARRGLPRAAPGEVCWPPQASVAMCPSSRPAPTGASCPNSYRR